MQFSGGIETVGAIWVQRAPARGVALRRVPVALYGASSLPGQSKARTEPQRQPARTGRRSPGGPAGLVPGGSAIPAFETFRTATLRKIRTGAILTGLLTLTACSTLTEPTVAVRHFPSTAFHEGTRLHLFVFDPNEPRSLEERIRLAKARIEAEPGCRWSDVPAVVIAEATSKQGAPWTDTTLAAPVDCTT